MKDKEIDDVLNETAQAPQHLKAETLQRLADSIKPSLHPVHPLPPAWLMTSGLVFICAAVALAGATRAGFYGIENMGLLERALIFPILLVFAWVAGSGFVREMIPGSRRRVPPSALLSIVIVLLVCVFALLFRDYRTSDFFSAGIACLLTGFLFALPAALLAWLLLRRGFAVNPPSAGLVAGTLGGLAGLGMLELHCPNFQAAHVLLWHTAVVPLSGAAGALVAQVLHLWASSDDPGRTLRK